MSYTLWKFGSPLSDPVVEIGDVDGVWLSTLGNPEDPLDTQGTAVSIVSTISGSIVDGHGAQQAPVTPVEITKKGLLVAATQEALHNNFRWFRAQRGRRRQLWRLVRRFEGPPGSNPPIQFMYARCTAINSGVARQFGDMYALPVEIRFTLLGRFWSGSRTNNQLEGGEEPDTWGEQEMDNSGNEAVVTYTNGGNTNNTSPIITIAATGDDIEAVHLACNVCAWTYTGVVPAGSQLVIDCGARSVRNAGIGDYNGLTFDSTHRTSEWMILEPGVNMIVYTIQTKNQGSTPPPTINFDFYDAWE